MKYLILTENDISQWNDETGKLYHFPNRYKNLITSGTIVVYYKGSMKDKSFENKRLSKQPHYFAIAKIGEVTQDTRSHKRDYFAEITDFQEFHKPVIFKQNGNYIEEIPSQKIKSYWRDGVRVINKKIFDRIIEFSTINPSNETIDSNQQELEFPIDVEGNPFHSTSIKYERNQKLRNAAIEYHGYSCMACEINFGIKYGAWGQGFIHVHHIEPLSVTKSTRKVNPKTDMIVLCPNCHAMVHREKNKTLSLDDLKMILQKK